MSSPGGSGNWGPNQHGAEQYYDPITGQPVGHTAPTGHSGQQQGSGTHYQGFGMFEQGQYSGPYATGGPQPAPPRKSRAPLIATLAITAVGALVVTATVLIVRDSEGRAIPATTSETTTSTAPAGKTENVRKPVSPVVPGWKGMALLEFGIAYDVPPNWKPETGSVSGFEGRGEEKATLSGFSGYKKDFCPQDDMSYRARVGISGADERDPVVAAEQAIRKWARLGWGTEAGAPPAVTMNPPKPVSVDDGRVDGQLVSATITPAEPGPCVPPTMFVSVLALPNDSGAALLIGLADQGVPDAVAPADIDRALTSVRWLPD